MSTQADQTTEPVISVTESRLDTSIAPATPSRRRHQRRRLRRLARSHRNVLLALGIAVGLLLLFLAFRAWMAYAAYQDLREDALILSTYDDRGLMTLSTSDLLQIQYRFADMSDNLERLDRATSVPLAGPVVERVPVVGPRYRAGRDTIAVARVVAEAGQRGARLGHEVMAAYETTGLRSDDTTTGETWLDVLARNETEIYAIGRDINRARALRASMNDTYLPEQARVRLEQMDEMLDSLDVAALTDETFPAMLHALGADQPKRYLILFPNPAEMRPAGGFPGEIALVEVHRGQLVSYEFFNVSQLGLDYIDQRSTKVPLPWPYEQYFWQDGFLIQDVVWRADFARMGAELMAMYAETDWPPIDGVAAVQVSLASDLLQVVGDVTVTVDGEERRITPHNLYEEVERQRRRRLEGATVETHHKDVIAMVGTEIIQRLMQGDRQQIRQAVAHARAAADRRDLQVYSADPVVQQWLDREEWSGRLVPDPETPTIAVVFGSLVAHKADRMMQPYIDLAVGPAVNGRREVTLDIDLEHTGTNEELPFYSGFQRWWVEITLPDGAERLETLDTPQPDPESPAGGSYLIEIFPQQVGHVGIVFSMPEDDVLRFRRQPGITPAELTVTIAGCPQPVTTRMDGPDVMVPLDGSCLK